MNIAQWPYSFLRSLTGSKSMCINHISRNKAHRDANIEGDGTEQGDTCFDLLVKVVRSDWSNRGIADPQSGV